MLRDIEDNYYYPNEQFGFKKDSLCMHATFLLRELVLRQLKLKNKKILVTAIHASKAFECIKVNQYFLWSKKKE